MIVPGLLPPHIALHVAHELLGLLSPPADGSPEAEHVRDEVDFRTAAALARGTGADKRHPACVHPEPQGEAPSETNDARPAVAESNTTHQSPNPGLNPAP